MTARMTIAARVCEVCESRFERRTFPSGRLEDATRFAGRRFCSRACYRKASADGYRIRPPGVWVTQPHQLKSAEGGFGAADPPLAVGVGYPWDRKRALEPVANPRPFPAGPMVRLPESRRERS